MGPGITSVGSEGKLTVVFFMLAMRFPLCLRSVFGIPEMFYFCQAKVH